MSSSRPSVSSDASRPPAGILTPSSDASLNMTRPASSSSMKQRIPPKPNALEDLLKITIVVKPYPPNFLSKPCTLQPLLLLPRQELPISLLDLAAPYGELLPSRLYESHVKILDLEDRMAESPSILVARSEATMTLYAIERADGNFYTVCKLGSWVNVEGLSAKATVWSHQLLQLGGPGRSAVRPAPLTTPQLHKGHKEKRLAIEALQSIVRKRGRSQSVSTLEDPPPADKRQKSDDDGCRSRMGSDNRADEEARMAMEDISPSETVPPQNLVPLQTSNAALDFPEQPTSENIFASLRAAYWEALYISKGSLAYFAKGPLSRARAAFHLDCDGTLNMSDLIDFLRSLILTTVKIDKKYRETVPDIISKMTSLVEMSDDGHKRKKRKPKNVKLGKNGLYPTEETQVRKWWAVNRPEISDEETNVPQSQIRSHVDLLRTRETQLQMVLIFEVMALEPLRVQEEETESQLPGLEGAPKQTLQASGSEEPKKRNKQKQNLPVLIDVHADRLCIWQSTASDEFRLLEDSQVAPDSNGGEPTQKASADSLKDFCTDIILPFFAARLPELCDSINRKLGGPITVSPPKPKEAHAAIKAKPGTAAKRPTLTAKKTKSLEGFLSKEQSRRSVSRGPSNTIALMRSATSAAIPGLKREPSEQSILKDMAKSDEKPTQGRSTLLSRSTSMTAVDTGKAQKRAMVDAELQDAINALRKPNRELAGKSVVEAAERRMSGGLSHIRKSKKPTRHPLFEGVQVKATPANNRFRDVFSADSRGGSAHASASALPSSSAPFVPGTAPRRSTRDFFEAFTSSAVKETPARTSVSAGRQATGQDDAAIPPSSPLMARKPAVQHGSNVADSPTRSRPRVGRSPSPGVRVHETPVKASRIFMRSNDGDDEILATPQANAGASQTKVSIYERLGWDDELDDL